ncbi:hypothetical protein JOQ06_007306, partial [Pogonophryne albipinna]
GNKVSPARGGGRAETEPTVSLPCTPVSPNKWAPARAFVSFINARLIEVPGDSGIINGTKRQVVAGWIE